MQTEWKFYNDIDKEHIVYKRTENIMDNIYSKYNTDDVKIEFAIGGNDTVIKNDAGEDTTMLDGKPYYHSFSEDENGDLWHRILINQDTGDDCIIANITASLSEILTMQHMDLIKYKPETTVFKLIANTYMHYVYTVMMKDIDKINTLKFMKATNAFNEIQEAFDGVENKSDEHIKDWFYKITAMIGCMVATDQHMSNIIPDKRTIAILIINMYNSLHSIINRINSGNEIDGAEIVGLDMQMQAIKTLL